MIVTMSDKRDSPLSLWIIREAHGRPQCFPGEAISCGETVRLTNLEKQKNLHSSEKFFSAISGRQEVFLFGENGEGNEGDDWIVVCNSVISTDERTASNYWQRNGEALPNNRIRLRHKNTNSFLTASREFMYGRSTPRIEGHLEVSAFQTNDIDSRYEFVVAAGIYFSKV